MADDLSSSPIRVLVVDDDADVAQAAALLLNRRGFQAGTAASPAEAWSAMAARAPDVVLLDLNFSRAHTTGAEGLEMLRRLSAQEPAPAVVVVTGHSGVSIAVEAMRAGAADFVMKPWNNDRLAATLEQVAARRRRGAPADAGAPALDTLVGESPAFTRVRDLVERAGRSGASLLICGEEGTGKTLAAQVAHRASPRASAPLVVLDAAYADSAELDARWEAAQGGALLLEQVEALAPALQARLADRLVAGDAVRMIATRRTASPADASGLALRADLHDRLSTVEVRMPSLAERPGDPELLARHFLRLFATRHGRSTPALAPEAVEALRHGPWPGDVRGLRRGAERAVILEDHSPFLPTSESAAPVEGADLNLERSERALIARSLKLHGFSVSRAAEALGLTRAALYRRMTKHGL